MFKRFNFIFLAVTCLLQNSYSQVANDDCAGAISLGTLGTPAACPSGQGTALTSNLSNVGAIAENPYSTIQNCQPSGNNMASPAADVWYSFTVTGNSLDITITGGINNPNIGLYEGNCIALNPRGCAEGTGGSLSATFDQMLSGATYYIQISGGDVFDQGNFTLTLQNNNSCNDCLLSSSLTVTPSPVNGIYQSGQTVTFCYTITEWSQENTNWLHGVVPVFGAGWDLSTLTSIQPAATCDGGPGIWQWFTNVSTPDGNLNGFFFDGDAAGFLPNNPDGDPTNNFGDNCGTGGTSVDPNPNWQFCWTITTQACPPASSGADIGIEIFTYADGETGNWTNIACQNDPNYLFSATLTCCPAPIISTSNSSCTANNGTATADGQGTGPWDYVWTDSSGTTIQTSSSIAGADSVTGLAPGVYFVTVTDNSDSCVTTGAATITSSSATLTVSANCTDATSSGGTDGSSSAVPSGGVSPFTYLWSDGQTTSTATGLAAGNYSVTVADVNGCTGTAICSVNEPPFCTVTTSATNVSCYGGNDGNASAAFSGGIPPYTYNWSTGQTDSIATGLVAGTYSLTVTDNTPCTEFASITIIQPSSAVSNNIIGANVSCFGDCNGSAIASTSGGTSPYSYLWSGGQVISNPQNLCAGTYFVTITDGNGCTLVDNVIITEPNPFTVSISTATSNCGQPDGSAAITSVTGGQNPGNYTYQWDSNAGSQVAATASGLTNGTYSVTITSGICDTIVSATIGNVLPPITSATATDALCNSSCDGTATANPSGGTTPYTYSYSWNDTQTGQTATGLCAGNYSVTVTDNNNGCTAVTSVSVSEPTAITLTTNPFPDTSICVGTSAIISANASGGTSPYSYLWDNGSTTNSQTVSPLLPICYIITITDGNGCTSAPMPVCVDLYDSLNPTAFIDQTICEGTQLTLSATSTGGNTNNPYVFTWLDLAGNTLGNGSFLTFTPQGSYPNSVQYVISVSDNCSPSATDTVTIDFYPTPVATFLPDSTFGCEPFLVTLLNTSQDSAINCLWDMGDGTYLYDCNTINYTYNYPGSYDINLTIVSPNGCMGSSSSPGNVFVAPNPNANFSFEPQPTTVQDMEINFTDLSTGSIFIWDWTFYDNNGQWAVLDTDYVQNPFYNFSSDPTDPFIYHLEDTGSYPVNLHVTTPYGCTDDTTLYVEIDGVFYFNLPNAFTPNGDGINDYFFPIGIGIEPYTKFRLMIFNRWGDVIFDSQELDNPWDGVAHEIGGTEVVPNGVYIWRLEVEPLNEDKIAGPFTGHVTVLR